MTRHLVVSAIQSRQFVLGGDSETPVNPESGFHPGKASGETISGQQVSHSVSRASRVRL